MITVFFLFFYSFWVIFQFVPEESKNLSPINGLISHETLYWCFLLLNDRYALLHQYFGNLGEEQHWKYFLSGRVIWDSLCFAGLHMLSLIYSWLIIYLFGISCLMYYMFFCRLGVPKFQQQWIYLIGTHLFYSSILFIFIGETSSQTVLLHKCNIGLI